MRRAFVILGVVLMVVAFVILFLFIIGPSMFTIEDAPLLKNVLQTLACQPGENLTASYSTYDTPTSTTRSTDLSCVDSGGNARDVSGNLIGIGAVGYFVPFLVGLFMTIIAGNQKKTSTSYTGNFIRVNSRNTDDFLTPTAQDYASAPEPDHKPLAQRLQELKDAYSAGLITEAEYKAKRAEVLEEN